MSLFSFAFLRHYFAAELNLSSGWNLIMVPLNSSSVLIDDYLENNLSSGKVSKNLELRWGLEVLHPRSNQYTHKIREK